MLAPAAALEPVPIPMPLPEVPLLVGEPVADEPPLAGAPALDPLIELIELMEDPMPVDPVGAMEPLAPGLVVAPPPITPEPAFIPPAPG